MAPLRTRMSQLRFWSSSSQSPPKAIKTKPIYRRPNPTQTNSPDKASVASDPVRRKRISVSIQVMTRSAKAISVIRTWPRPMVDGPKAKTSVPSRTKRALLTNRRSKRLPTTTTAAATTALSRITAPIVLSGVTQATPAINVDQIGGQIVTGRSKK